MKAAFVGRLCPIHLGHERTIDAMIDFAGGPEHCLMVLGSSNSPFSLRHFFSYTERRAFVSALYPMMPIVGLPDFPTDEEWLIALDDIMRASNFDPASTTFFGGCEEDVRFFADAGRAYKIVSRFAGKNPKISSTEVRDALIHERDLSDLLNPKITTDVQRVFKEKWERFKNI